jgi:hypothetical protein
VAYSDIVAIFEDNNTPPITLRCSDVLQRIDYPLGIVAGDIHQRPQLSILQHARHHTERAVNNAWALSSESRKVDRVQTRALSRRHSKRPPLPTHDIDEAPELRDAGPCGP